jgi:four helix bundle protein
VAKSYKDLVAWQKAMDLAVAVYGVTRMFPKEEIYALTSQVRRAAVSVPSNIAEGQGRGSKTDFQRFTRIAIGSLQEVETQLLLGSRLEYVSQLALDPVLRQLDEVARITRGLQKSLEEPQ